MSNILRTAVLAVFSSITFSAFSATPDLPSCDQWYPAASCNYEVSSRPSSYPISYVVIHKVQGTAASAVSWFQNCAAVASTHYSFDNSTGYCYQSVYEKDIAWHGANYWYAQRSVGIEHGGYDGSNDTAAICYDESALETKSCIIYYTVQYSRSYIIGHQEIPGCSTAGYGGQSCSGDPGRYWNWTYYMSKCNPNSAKTYTNDSPAASSNWTVGTSAGDKYGADYKFRGTAAVSDPATWTSSLEASGSYDIHAWWSQGTNRSASAPYILPDGTKVSKNQQANGGSWQFLANKSLGSGSNAVKLSCWTTTGFVVIADAVKFYGPK